MHSTLVKFGYPDTRLAETEHWCVLLRPVQVTLGSIVIVFKDADVRSLSNVPSLSFAEFPRLCAGIEKTLFDELGAKKFNYLALMMVDPHVHFHVIPRYDFPVELANCIFNDNNWPGPPDITANAGVDPETFALLKARLASALSHLGSI